MLNKIVDEIIILERLEEIANVAEANYDTNPESEEAEKAFDEAYKNEFNAFMRVSNTIASFAGIDIKTAREMVRTQREKLLSALK